MAINFTAANNYSWMSQASYLDLSTVISGDADSLVLKLKTSSLNNDKIFAAGQATSFTDPTTGYSLISQLPNTTNGTSLTVFKSNDTNDGSYTISVRGTEPETGIDLVADVLGVVGAGKAKVQLFEAFRYYKKLITPVGQPVIYSTAEVDALSSILFSGTTLTGVLENITAARVAFNMLTASDAGLGMPGQTLIPPGAKINFTGHSLGGHVAYLLAQLVDATSGGTHPVGDVMTYNAPGENALLYELQNWCGIDTSSQGGAIGSKHLAFYGEGGLNVTAGLGQMVGTRVPLLIEKEGPLSLENHSIVKLSDSLAVYNLYAKLDPSLDAAKLKTLIQSASAAMPDSLERTLDALRAVFFGSDALTTGKIPTDNRESFYTNLATLQASAEYQSLAGSATLRVLASQSADSLASRARADFGDFLALNYLLPIAIEGSSGVLGTVHADLYAQWQADQALTSEQRAKGEGNFSDQYLADRAAFLTWKLKLATEDFKTTDGAYTSAPDAFFHDMSSGLQINLGSNGTVPADKPRYLFASNDGGTLSGGGKSDRLYGGARNDVLYGYGSADALNGGAGSDTLSGGEGNDTLNGGAGNDTYQFSSGDGWDWIEDEDGQGCIKIDSDVLTGGREAVAGSGLWESTDPDKKYQYLLYTDADGSKTLNIIAGADRLFIKNYSADKNLGITLQDAPAGTTPTVPAASRTILGDLAPIDFDAASPGINMHADDIGNIVTDPGMPEVGREDTLYDSTGDDNIVAGAGKDFIDAWRGGNDRLEAGAGGDSVLAGPGDDRVEGDAGDDFLSGEDGKDTLAGGADSDIVMSNAGDDELFAEARQGRNEALLANNASTGSSAVRGDWLDGSDGEDLLVGGADADVLLGGGDKDLLIGGAGNDDLWGDTLTVTINWDWSLERQVEKQDDSTLYKSQLTRASTLIVAGADDRMFGGSGDDWMNGFGGNDFMDGGADNDVAFGMQGDDRIAGSGGDDVLSGDMVDDAEQPEYGLAGALHGNDCLDGGEGNDGLAGNGGDDVLMGGAGNDSLTGDDPLTPGQYHGDDYVDGGEGRDRIWGDGGSDVLTGGAGDDQIEGDNMSLDVEYQSKDTLSGGSGDDTLFGEGAADVLWGGDGDDLLFGDEPANAVFSAAAQGDDLLYGEKGDDDLLGGGGGDQLYGGEGNDSLDGGSGADVLHGGFGQDSLRGGADSDILDGGAGIDMLDGGEGDDRLTFSTGDCPYVESGLAEGVDDESGSDTVVFADAVADNLTLRIDTTGTLLVIDYSATDRLLIDGGLAGSVEYYAFVNGECLSFAELIGRRMDGVNHATTGGGQNVTMGGRDDNVIGALSGGSLVSGGRGNDVLTGNGGGNTYLYSRGDGSDTIRDDSKVGGFAAANTLRFGSGINPADIKLGLGSLLIRVGDNPADVIHIEGFNPADVYSQHPIDRFEFANGTVLTYEQLLARGFDLDGSAGNDDIAGTNISDRFDGKSGDDTLRGAAGDDTLLGGAGNDSLAGGAGSDTYRWGAGSGQDVIDNADASPGKTDTLSIDGGLLPEDLLLTRSGNNLLVRVRSTGDQLTVLNHYAGAAIDVMMFANGTVWNASNIDAHLVNILTEGADTYTGTEGDDNISGLGGNDTLSGIGGNDVLTGGTGADSLYGGNGSDTLDGRGDVAPDLLQGESGGDLYLFGRGSGADTINELGDIVSTDILRLDTGITPSDVTLRRTGSALVLQINGTTDQVTVNDQFVASGGAAAKIERIEFADATVWTETEIRQRVLLSATTSGNDTIVGFDGADTLTGGAGTDYLSGGVGDDLYIFAAGDSPTAVSGTVETIQDGAGRNVTRFDGISLVGLKVSKTAGGDLVLSYTAGDTIQIVGGANAERISEYQFADGVLTHAQMLNFLPQVFNGTSGNDSIRGGEGDDSLLGFAGDDTLDGGLGDDRLYGDAGNNTYLFGRNDGRDLVCSSIEQSNVGKVNTLQFKAGIRPEDIEVTQQQVYFDNLYSSITLKVINANDSVTINFFSYGGGEPPFLFDDPYNAHNPVQQIRFSDGTIWDIEAIKAKLFAGTAGDDAIRGTKTNDAITGGAGNDNIYGLVGNDSLIGGVGNDALYGSSDSDTLDGGAGNDTLDGGPGNDTYLFGRGSGNDVLTDNDDGLPETDVLQLGAGITPQEITISGDRDSRACILSIASSTDTLTLLPNLGVLVGADSHPDVPLERLQFADGTTVDLFDSLVGTKKDDDLYSNTPLINVGVDGGLGNDTIRGGVGNDALLGGEGNDSISGGYGIDSVRGGTGNDTIYGDKPADYSYTQGGDDLLYGDEGDDTLVGGNFLDNAYKTGVDTLDGGAGNDRLYYANTVRYGRNYGQDRVIGGAKTLELFDLLPTDIDLEYQADGMAFKVKGSSDWLKVEGPTGRINVDRVNFSNGAFWDVGALEALGGSRANRPPQLNISFPEIAAVQGQAFSYVIPENAFIDPDGDALIWSVQGRPWESYNPLTRTLSGTPGNAEVGRQTVEVRVTDTAGASTSQTIVIDVANINDAPSTGAPIPALVLKDGFAVDQSLPADAFTDIDVGDVLTYSATLTDGTALPGWLSINASTGKLSGTVPVGEFGDMSIRITATDVAGAPAHSDLMVTIVKVSGCDNTVTGTAGDDVLDGDAGSNCLDGGTGNDTLTGYAGDDVLLGGSGNDNLSSGDGNDVLMGGDGDDGLFDGRGNDTLIGGSGNDVYGTYMGFDLLIDESGWDSYGINRGNLITPNNETRIIDQDGIGSVIVNSEAVNGQNVTATSATTWHANNDAYTLTLSGSDLWISLNDRPSPDMALGQMVIQDFSDMTHHLGIVLPAYDPSVAINHVPTVVTPIADQRIEPDSAFSLLIPAGSFADADGGALAYSSTLADGSALPAWLAFDAATRTFSGTPSSKGTISVRVQATDSGNWSVSNYFDIVVDITDLTLNGTASADALTGGNGNDTLNGLAGNDTLNGGAGSDILRGGQGDDTYIVDIFSDEVIEAVNEGIDFVQSSASYTLSANVENLTLTGADAIEGSGNALDNVLIGNGTANTLNGGDGNDTFDGGAGDDILNGGAGDDTYVVDAYDSVIEAAGGGIDTVRSSINFMLADNVENLILTGTANIEGIGSASNNTLTGNSGNNKLSGGAGADTLIGGAGNDTYYIDNVGDVVTEALDEGADLVQSSVTYALGANVENLTLTGTAALNGTGNALNNKLTGNAGANILDGGAGSDTLIGGAGNDIYYVGTGDIVTEAASAGTDTVIADTAWTLGGNLENLTLSGTAAINGTGNTLNNTLLGNGGANVLSGGTGADTMRGGAGNDTYVVDNTGDVVTENLGEGSDLVQSSVTHALSANVENLTLSGSTAINGTGNVLDNVLTGNGAINTLTGGAGSDTLDGKAAADTMIGGLGDDSYTVDNAADVVTENAGEGSDLVNSSVSLTLAANVEALALSGTTALNGTGNALNNLVRGNTGVNTLNGGAGNDILEGGAGNDILTDTAGTALFNGGAGTDTLTGGAAAEIFLGGLGNDTYSTAAGNDLVLFNKGDGQDTFATGGTGSDTLSLGGGVLYTDLSFSKSSNDLVLKVGTTDQITFKNWYATTPSRPVLNLQMIAEAMADFAPGGADPLRDQKVENFNFAGLVGAFDAARAANAGLTNWTLTNALASFQLAGSDSAALGGDLAYQYGRNGTLAGIGLTPALDVLGNAALGASAQTLTPLAGLQVGSQRLS